MSVPALNSIKTEEINSSISDIKEKRN